MTYIMGAKGVPMIKVGESSNPEGRLKQFKHEPRYAWVNELLYRSVPIAEHTLHEILSPWRVDSESYVRCPEVEALIEELVHNTDAFFQWRQLMHYYQKHISPEHSLCFYSDSMMLLHESNRWHSDDNAFPANARFMLLRTNDTNDNITRDFSLSWHSAERGCGGAAQQIIPDTLYDITGLSDLFLHVLCTRQGVPARPWHPGYVNGLHRAFDCAYRRHNFPRSPEACAPSVNPHEVCKLPVTVLYS